MYQLIAIVGEAGTGKDSLLRAALKTYPSLHKVVGCTTRPRREKEVNGRDYYFLSEEVFAKKVLDFSMLEATTFNDWFYGTSLESLDANKINIGIFNPSALEILYELPDFNILTLRLVASDKERLIRQLNREQNPDVDEIVRRYQADKADFSYLDFPYFSCYHETYFDQEEVIALLGRWLAGAESAGTNPVNLSTLIYNNNISHN